MSERYTGVSSGTPDTIILMPSDVEVYSSQLKPTLSRRSFAFLIGAKCAVETVPPAIAVGADVVSFIRNSCEYRNLGRGYEDSEIDRLYNPPFTLSDYEVEMHEDTTEEASDSTVVASSIFQIEQNENAGGLYVNMRVNAKSHFPSLDMCVMTVFEVKDGHPVGEPLNIPNIASVVLSNQGYERSHQLLPLPGTEFPEDVSLQLLMKKVESLSTSITAEKGDIALEISRGRKDSSREMIDEVTPVFVPGRNLINSWIAKQYLNANGSLGQACLFDVMALPAERGLDFGTIARWEPHTPFTDRQSRTSGRWADIEVQASVEVVGADTVDNIYTDDISDLSYEYGRQSFFHSQASYGGELLGKRQILELDKIHGVGRDATVEDALEGCYAIRVERQGSMSRSKFLNGKRELGGSLMPTHEMLACLAYGVGSGDAHYEQILAKGGFTQPETYYAGDGR